MNNPPAESKEVIVKIYVDNYATTIPNAEITDTIPSESKKTLVKSVSELNLALGKRFIYCSL